MLVQLAAIVAALMGVTGLAIDVGFVTIEKRVLQNAVDAAVVSGAIDMVQPTYHNGNATYTTAGTVNTMANKNDIPAGTTVICEYVNGSDTVTGACSSAPLNTSNGVKVTASHTRDNFFMRVLGIPTTTIVAQGTARASAMTSYEASKSLFVVCGFSTFTQKHAETGGTFVPDPTKEFSILTPSMPGQAWYDVDMNAVGKWFIIHADQVQDAACELQPASFKGLHDTEGVVALDHTLHTLDVNQGNQAGPTNYAVDVENGCKLGNSWDAGQKGCVMYVPIAVGSPAPDHLYAWTWLPFHIVGGVHATANPYHPDLNIPGLTTNSHVGKLLGANMVTRYDPNMTYGTWTVGTQSGPVVVQLVK